MAFRIGLVLMVFLAPIAGGASNRCADATTLDQLALCIRAQMPASGSNEFVEPSAEQFAAWRIAVRQMLGGSCASTLPDALTGIAERRTLVDAGNRRSYCVLMETADEDGNAVADRGWGAFVVDPNARRELSQQAPHPIADAGTDAQAMGVFKATRSRSYLVAGSHRAASSEQSICQPKYKRSDPAHGTASMFHATNLELKAWYAGRDDWYAIQWHGMAPDTCPDVDVYLSHGADVIPSQRDPIARLRARLVKQHPQWRVATPGTRACSLNARDNTQGRVLNGVTGDACSSRAESYSGRFIHIEQDPGYRNAADWSAALSDALR